jgi:hypothetical protein
VHLYGPLPVLARTAHRDLQMDRVVRGQHEGRLQGQLLDAPASGRVPGQHGHLDERRPRQQHRPGHGVVGQPRLRTQRQPPDQHQPVARGQLDHRAKQRMTDRREARRRDIRA